MKTLPAWLFRVGTGFDTHAFGQISLTDVTIYLCGLPILYNRSIIAHSDGDVVLHAVADAIFGAMGMENIGYYFSEQSTKAGFSSIAMIEKALQIVEESNGMLINVDAVVICEEPKISRYRESFKRSLSDILKLPFHSVNIKGVTTEKLGSIGRGEGIACHAVCSIMIPNVTI